jgi:ribonuclease HI
LHAELSDIYHGLEMAKNHDEFQNVIVESDALMVINIIQGGTSPSCESRPLILQIIKINRVVCYVKWITCISGS